jgi:hypothetical protein
MALVDMASKAQGRTVLDLLKLTGFKMPNETIYDGIADMVAKLRGVL